MGEKKDSEAGIIFLVMMMIGLILAVIGLTFYVVELKKENAKLTEEATSSANNAVVTPVVDEEKEIEIEEEKEVEDTEEIDEGNLSTANNNDDDIEYTFSTRGEVYDEDGMLFTITATKDGKTFSKEFNANGMVGETAEKEISKLGKVALVCSGGGEYVSTGVYKLVNGEIKKLGDIYGGADTSILGGVDYVSTKKDEGVISISATKKIDNQSMTKEIETIAAIGDVYVDKLLGESEMVFVEESGGEYFGIHVYGLSQDYITGQVEDIIELGVLTGIFE